MMPHSHEDDLQALALGALDLQEARSMHEHLGICGCCRMAVKAYHAVASLLPYAAEPQEPPPGLKQRLLAQLAGQRVVQSYTVERIEGG